MDVQETHLYTYTFEVEAETREEAEELLQEAPYEYELDYECYDTPRYR